MFLRSRTLEFALDAAARSAPLHRILRESALPPPDTWPENRSPPLAFARAFVTLLMDTIGPPDTWFQMLAALLSSESGPVDDLCHLWLAQLIAGLRVGWEGAGAQDHEREVAALEEAASQSSSSAEQIPVVEASPGSLAVFLASLSQRGTAAKAAYRARSQRCAFAEELQRAVSQCGARVQARAEAAATIASASAEHVAALEAEAVSLGGAAEERRRDLGSRAEELRSQLADLEPVGQQLQREIEEAETMHRELLQQLGQLVERIEVLHRQQAAASKQEGQLREELLRAEGLCATKLAAEDKQRQRSDSARALAASVSHFAASLAATPTERIASDTRSVSLIGEAEKSRRLASAAALRLAENV